MTMQCNQTMHYRLIDPSQWASTYSASQWWQCDNDLYTNWIPEAVVGVTESSILQGKGIGQKAGDARKGEQGSWERHVRGTRPLQESQLYLCVNGVDSTPPSYVWQTGWTGLTGSAYWSKFCFAIYMLGQVKISEAQLPVHKSVPPQTPVKWATSFEVDRT